MSANNDVILSRINGLLTAVNRQQGIFEKEIKKAETAILEKVGAEMATQGYEIGRLRERADRLEADLSKIADKLRDVSGVAKDNSRKMVLAGSVVGVVLGTGGTLSVSDILGGSGPPDYEERASAIVDAAARCNTDDDMADINGKRVPSVRCVNMWLDGKHAGRYEIDTALRWAE